MEYVWMSLVVLVASLVKGITGFGFALIALPVLEIWFSPKELIPVMVLCNLISSGFIVLQKKERQLINPSYRALIIYGGLFTIAGVLTLNYLSENALLYATSIIFLLMSLLSLSGMEIQFNPKKYLYKITGGLVGFLSGSISVSGPPLAIFLHSTKADKQEFREVFSWFSIITALVAIVGYWLLGLFSLHALLLTVLTVPLLFLGSFFGKKLNRFLPAALFQKATLVLTLVSCLILLINLL